MQTLRDRVTLLCEQATEAIRRSLTALLEDDEALAREVGANDAQINVAQFDIEEYAYSLLSERKLAVSEVRRIVGMIVLTRVLEQVGGSRGEHRAFRREYEAAGSHGGYVVRFQLDRRDGVHSDRDNSTSV
ncbi:MAG: hypothetical protein HND48_16700 [Chloroflexi bacterium]|nr:hypothetical protein [Chloroflexota bacterium]